MFAGGRPAELASLHSTPLLPDGKTSSSELPAHGRGAVDEITQPPPEVLAAGSQPEHLPVPLWQRLLRFCFHNWDKVIVLVVLLVLIILVSVKGVTVFKDIIVWFEKQNNWIGWTCFTLLYMINIAVLLPGIFMILGAGFVFGFWKGLLAVWLGGGIGQSLAFLLARYLVGDWVSALARGKSKKWDVIDKAMELEGWKLLLLVRLSPLVPYNLLNICMAATKIHFWQFAVVSFFGVIPECALFTYTGSLAENIGAIVSGEAKPRAVVTYVMAGVTVALLLATTTWATILIRRALKRADLHLREDPETGCREVDAGNSLPRLAHDHRTDELGACPAGTAARQPTTFCHEVQQRLRSAPATLHPSPDPAPRPFAARAAARSGRSSRSGRPYVGSGSPHVGPNWEPPERSRSAGAGPGASLGAAWRHSRGAAERRASADAEASPAGGVLGANLGAELHHREAAERQGSVAVDAASQPPAADGGRRPQRGSRLGARSGRGRDAARRQSSAEHAGIENGEPPAAGGGMGATLGARRHTPERQGSAASAGADAPLAPEAHRFWFGGGNRGAESPVDGVPLLDRAASSHGAA